MNAVETVGLFTKRGVKTILNDINLTVRPGEHTVLFGLNGCGKTTLLATICGYMGFSSGTVQVFNEILNEENTISVRKKIGFVSNSYFNRLYSRENALNIVLGAVFGELSERVELRKEHVLRAKHLLKCLGLKNKLAYPYDMLSYGQQQRVLIARGLMVSPKILVLDEPCSGLDVLMRQYVLNTLASIAMESGTTIICATHYLEEILPFYKKGILMKSGKIFADGSIEEVFSGEILSDFFETKTESSWTQDGIKLSVLDNYHIPEAIWK